MSAPTRPCLACEGTGIPYADEPIVGFGSYEESRCPVCLGSGAVEAKPSVRDAVADAETLLKLARTPIHRASWGGYLEYNANNAKRHLIGGEGWYPQSWVVQAARAAFRAVPGLRALALLLILLAAPFASAGEHHKLDFATPLLIHGGAQAFDHFSTQAALARGGHEVGPIASKTGPNAARLIGGAAFLGADLLAQKHGPGWLKWVVRGASVGVSAYAVSRNGRVR